MRIAVEYIPDSGKILVRLLAVPSFPVQTGTYVVDAFPQIAYKVSFDIDSDQVVNGEAKVYLTGFYPLPSQVAVTLPDLTVETIVLNQVVQPLLPRLAEQPLLSIEKHEQPDYVPLEAAFKMDGMSPAAFPLLWVELNLSHGNPVKVGAGMTSSDITYAGGAAGRVLDTNVTQTAQDTPPFIEGASTHLEGAITNTLSNSDFSATGNVVGFFDPQPTGWVIALNDPTGLIRTRINPNSNTVLPHFELNWYQSGNFFNIINSVPVVVTSPPVAANSVFQVMVVPSSSNSAGTIQLKSATGVNTTTAYLLNGAQILTLNVGADPGGVKIYWNQGDGNGAIQTLTLFAPMATTYSTPHTYVPTAVACTPDLLTVPLIGGLKLSMIDGYFRLDSEQELLGEPLSWLLKFSSGPIFLKVDQGVVSSDFSTSAPFSLLPFLTTDPATTGAYRLRWNNSGPVRIFTKLSGQADLETILPLSFDVPVPDLLLNSTMELQFSAYSPTAGSSILRYFVYKPKDTVA